MLLCALALYSLPCSGRVENGLQKFNPQHNVLSVRFNLIGGVHVTEERPLGSVLRDVNYSGAAYMRPQASGLAPVSIAPHEFLDGTV